MKNIRIKQAMLEAGLYQWQVAELLGIHEGSLSRKMRKELPEEEQNKIIELIKNHKKGNS